MVLTALFWTIWYSTVGELPMVPFVETLSKKHYVLAVVFSRWWDILFVGFWTISIIKVCSRAIVGKDENLGFDYGLACGLYICLLIIMLAFAIIVCLGVFAGVDVISSSSFIGLIAILLIISLIIGFIIGGAYGPVNGLITVLGFGLGFGLSFGLVTGLFIGLIFNLGVGLAVGLAVSLGAGLAFNLTVSLLFWLGAGLVYVKKVIAMP